VIIRRLFLDGYGRFMGREIEFSGGLQVVLGANEQGKTTLRSFITDMLYGQKAAGPQRQYDESHHLRRPWADDRAYGGRMTYLLDTGQKFEIRRVFERGNESVHVLNLSDGRDITGDFALTGNEELELAAQQLGLSKAIFANVAVIGHNSLESLGDEDALLQISERIAALADTADEFSSSAAAVSHLDAYTARIGRLVPNSKRPLPLARARLSQVETERAEALRVREEVAGLEKRLRSARAELETLRRKQAKLELQLRRLEHTARITRLQKAENIQHQIETLTQRLFSLAKAKDFPLEQDDVFNRALNAMETAREQVARTEARMTELLRRHQEASQSLKHDAVEIQDLPEQFEDRLKELDTQIARLRDFIEDFDKAQQTVREAIAQAERELEDLPDFTALNAEPLAWINQQATSFSLALQERDHAVGAFKRLEADCDRREAELAQPEKVFGQFEDFPAQARDHAVEAKLSEERCAQQRKRIEEAQRDLEIHEEDLPNFRAMTLFGALLSIILLIIAALTGNKGIYFAEIFALGVLVYNMAHWVHARLTLRQLQHAAEAAGEEIERLERATAEREQAIDAIIREAGCESFRELEALYEQYIKGRNELEARREELEPHRSRARVEESHVAGKLERLQTAFADLHETVKTEDAVEAAAARAIAKYQEYRELSRRREEQMEQLETLTLECDRANEKLAAKEAEEKQLSLEVRKLLREAGYKEEANHTSALGALRAYGIRIAQLRPRRARADALIQQADEFGQQLEQDRRELQQAKEDLSQLLDNVGVDAVDEYRALAAQAREYREARILRTSLGEQFDTLLGNDSLESLRAEAEREDNDVPLPLEEAPDLKAALEHVVAETDSRSREIHSLELAIAERCAGLRTINEIEEEQAAVSQRVEDLQLELEAAAHAAALIEEVARDRHARIAPVLAQTASRYLSRITNNAYTELQLDRGLQVMVRVPQTDQLQSAPQKNLSKGTVDQIYLALRLALVTCLSEEGERVPMLLDDPFANYDDVRLAQALALLTELKELPQILLFTCRDDVADSARRLQVPVLAL
jgi:uncharacterized protein YhaN